jgi:hypothetical protein
MKSAITGLAAAAVAMTAVSETIRFDTDPVGAIPAGWTCGVTGRGNPKWDVQPDASLNPPTRVLLQSGSGAFPWCVRTGMSVADGFVEVKFRPVSGREDQAGGVVWRWKDGDNYYVARANALEDNVSLYYTAGGRRNTLKYVDAPVPPGTWHRLRVEFSGRRIAVVFNGKAYIELEDRHIAGAGAVGMWTKADSITAFDDFRFAAAAPGPA